MEPLEKYLSIFMLFAAVIAQLYTAFKVIAQSSTTRERFDNFEKVWAEHLKSHNEIAKDVAFIKGRLDV